MIADDDYITLPGVGADQYQDIVIQMAQDFFDKRGPDAAAKLTLEDILPAVREMIAAEPEITVFAGPWEYYEKAPSICGCRLDPAERIFTIESAAEDILMDISLLLYDND